MARRSISALELEAEVEGQDSIAGIASRFTERRIRERSSAIELPSRVLGVELGMIEGVKGLNLNLESTPLALVDRDEFLHRQVPIIDALAVKRVHAHVAEA